jgi:hypothetical protein
VTSCEPYATSPGHATLLSSTRVVRLGGGPCPSAPHQPGSFASWAGGTTSSVTAGSLRDGRPVASWRTTRPSRPGSWGRARSRRSSASRRLAPNAGARCSTWSTPPARASPTRSRCSRAVAARAASSTTRCKLSGDRPADLRALRAVAAGGAYIPAFCDVVVMVDKNASMYLGSPAHGRDGHRREGDARGDGRRANALRGLGCGDVLAKNEEEALAWSRARTSATCRTTATEQPPVRGGEAHRSPSRQKPLAEIVPATRTSPSTCTGSSTPSSTRAAFLEMKKLFAKELVTGLARIDGKRRRHRREPAQVQGRRALRRQRRQGRAVHLAVRRVQHPAALPGRRARLHDRHEGRAQGIIRTAPR